MDIPLPGEDVPEEIKPPDIPMPEDSNRYSPSVPIEDDPPPGIVPPLPPPPLPPPELVPQLTTTNSAKSLVLGKTQAKKRLLAFSMTKQGGGVGLSFSLNKKQAPLNKEAVKVFTGDEKTEEGKKKSKKGTREDKARDTISEIEELKRKEMLYRENMQLFHPRWGNRENHLYPSLTLPIPLSVDDIPTKRTVEIESIVGELFANKLKAKEEERKHSDVRERRRKSSKRSPDKDRERSSRRRKIKTLPHDWAEFKKEGHRIHNFRRFKYEVEKEELRDKRRHRRGSRDRRSRSRERRDKMSKPGSDRANFLETPMIIKKVLHVLEARGGGDLEFPEYLIRYTNTKPKLTYCENPKIATYHLQSRREMLSTVPRDIEEIIFKFLNSIRAKRLRATTKSSVSPISVKVKKEEGEEEDDDVTDQVQSEISGFYIENDSVHNNDEQGVINSESNETTDDNTTVHAKEEVSDNGKIDDIDKIEEKITCHKHHREWFPIYKNSLVLSELVTVEDEDVEIEEFSVDLADNKNKVISKGGDNTVNNVERLPDNKATDKKLNEELEPIIRTAIRSKWDSDYEESPHVSDAEKTVVKKPEEDMENLSLAAGEEQMDIQGIDNEMCHVESTGEDNLGVVPMEVDNDKITEEGDTEEFIEEHVWNTVVRHQRQEGEGGDAVEKLASEYEEFMKMVASDNKEDLSDGQENVLISVSETVQDNSFSNSESKMKEDSPDYGDKAESRTQSPLYENQEEQNDTQNDNDIWSGKFGYTNRSRSQSSASSECVKEDDKLQVALRKKIIEKAMKKKKDKKKVHGSKIKKRSKNKKQKINKKKKKKQSSSESSSSSSSSSSSQSSSSSSSSSSDESSSSDSSSSSSVTSSSSSSSDSSMDKKKVRKRKKLKKLKHKLKLKKKKRHASESSSSSEDDDEDKVKSEKNKKKRKKTKSVKKLKRKTLDEEDGKLKKNKASKRNKDKKNKGKEYVDSNDEEENVKMKKNKHEKKKKKSSDTKKSKYDSSDEEKSKKSKKSKNKESSDKKQGKRKSKEFESDDENYMRLKELGFVENDSSKESSFKVKSAVLSEVHSKEGKYDKRPDGSVKGKRKMKEFEDESDNSDIADRDNFVKRSKHADSDSASNRVKKSKSKDRFETGSEDVYTKEKNESKRKIGYDGLDASIDNENSRRSSVHSTKQWDDDDNSNSRKLKTKIPASALDNESRSKKWETEESETFKDNETFSQREVDSKIPPDKTTSHGWESDDESDENDQCRRGIESDMEDNSENVQVNMKKLHDEVLKTKKKSKKDSKKKKSKQHEYKGSSDEEKRSKKKKKKSKKSSKNNDETSEKTDYLNIFFQNEERSNHDQKYYHQHKTDFDFGEYSSTVRKESEESANSGAAHNKSNDSLKRCHDENKHIDSLDENSRDEGSKDEHSFNDSVKSRSHYEWSDDSQTVASFAKHKDEEKFNEESMSKDDWTKENSSQYLSEESNSKSSKTVLMGDYLKSSEETNKIIQEENKAGNKNVEENTLEQTESLQKEVSEESNTFTFLKSFKKDRKREHSEESSDNSDGVKGHSTESSIDGLDFDSQQDSFELEKDIALTKNTENTDSSKKERAFSEISMPASDNQMAHSNSSSKLTNDSERYSPTLDLDAGSPSSINKYESDMSLDSNEPGNFVGPGANQDVSMLDIPLPPQSATVFQAVEPLCVPPPTSSVSVCAAISSSAPAPVPVPAPVPAPVPVPPPVFQSKITSSSFKNVLNIPSFPPLPSDPESKHMEQIEHHPIQLETELIQQIESKIGHGDSDSKNESLPLQNVLMPLKNTKITFHKPLLRTKTPNIFENSDEEEENETKKKALKIDFDNNTEKEAEEKMDVKQKKRSRWGMEPDDELPIVKMYLANEEVQKTPMYLASEEVQKTPILVDNKDEGTELYEGKTLIEDSELLSSVSNKSKGTEDSNGKSSDDLYKDIIDPTDIVEPEVHGTDTSKKDLLQEVWFEHSSSSSLHKPALVKEVDDSCELSENKSLCEDSDRHDNIQESHSDIISNTSDLNTASDEIQESLVKIKVEVESDEHTYNENFNYSDVNFQIKEEIENKPDDFELTTRSERSRSRSYSRDEYKKSRDYSPDRSYSSRRRASPRDRRYTRDRRRDSDRRRDRSRSRERRRDRSRERRRRDSPERRDRRKDRYRRESPPRKRERRDSPPARRDSPPRRSSPLRRDSPLRRNSPLRRDSTPRRNSPLRRDSPPSRRDSPSPRRDSSPLRRGSSSPRRESPLPRRDSPLPRRDSSPPRRDTPPPSRRDSPPSKWESPLLRRDSPSLQRRDSPSWGRNSNEKNVLSSASKQSDVYHQMDFQDYKHDEKIPSYQLQSKSDVDRVPQSGHHNKESDTKTNSAVGCKRSKADSTISDSELITPKKIIVHSDLSPKRLSLDARIELELGVKKSPPPPPPPSVPTSVNVNQYPAYYQIPVHDGSQMIPVTQLPPQRRPPSTLVQPPQVEWNAEAFIGTAAQQHSQPKPKMVPGNSQVLQVGNILQVVPTEMTPPTPVMPPPTPVMPPKPVTPPVLKQIITTSDGARPQTKVVQIGNMLQVVPSTAIIPPTATVTNTPSPVPTPTPPPAPPTPPKPSPLSLPLPVIKKELPLPPLPVLPEVSEKAEFRRLEKERRRKEKELKRQQKFKKATKKIIKKLLYKEGLTTNTDVENEDMQLIEEEIDKTDELDADEVPIPPRTKPVTPLPPPPDKGILVSPGFREKPILTEKLPTNKVVSFADGIRPGEGTSPSAGEDHPMSPPPARTLPKEKRFKKKKKKRKVKVRIIRVEEGDDDDDDDDDDDEDISPPPPPPGSPPPMFHYPPPPPGFMYHPPSFSVLQGSGEGQVFTPVYQQHHSSTTTTHTTTVQFAPPPPPPPQKVARK